MTVHGFMNAVYFVGIFVGMALGGDDPVDQLSGYMAVAVGTLGWGTWAGQGALGLCRSKLGGTSCQQ